MENRRSSHNKSTDGRRQFGKNRGSQSGGPSRGGSQDGNRRFFKKRSSASDGKMPPPRPGDRPKTKKPWENIKRPKITSELQVTDGRYEGELLTNIEKINSSVSARKVRESMFRLLARKVRAGRFLDLCAGNGTIGIEAISRGAMLGSFVERSARMMKSRSTSFSIFSSIWPVWRAMRQVGPGCPRVVLRRWRKRFSRGNRARFRSGDRP